MESKYTTEMEGTNTPVETDFTIITKEEDGSSSCDAIVGTEEEEDGASERRDRGSDGSDSGLGPEEEGQPVNAGMTNAPQAASPLPHTPPPLTTTPMKSTLKRRICTTNNDLDDGEPASKKKRSIVWDSVTVYYFPRAQGFTCVPSQGGSTLGMGARHSHSQMFTLVEHGLEQRRRHRQMLLQLRNQRLQEAAEGSLMSATPVSSSSEDSESDDETSELSDNDYDLDSYYCLQPVPTRQRRIMLRAAGVRKIDSSEKDECRDIRSSREFCGCACKGYCDPDTCSCARAGIKCQVDRLSFPCGCTPDGCANGAGRIEFNLERVRTHFIQTLMRLKMESNQSIEQEQQKQMNQWTSRSNGCGELPSASGLLAKHNDPKPGLHHISLSPNMESCIHGGNYTTLHYNGQQQQSVSRGEGLDLYSFREEEGFSSQQQQHSQNQENAKLVLQQDYCNFSFSHSTAFAAQNSNFAQQTHAIEFDSTYRFQDHNDYQHQIFTNSFSAPNFGNLQYEYHQNFVSNANKSENLVCGLSEIEFCDPSQVVTYSDNQLVFTQEEEVKEESSSISSDGKYTSLHPLSSTTTTKLEPFSELLGVQYIAQSPSSFATTMFQPTASFSGCESNLVSAPIVKETEPRHALEECVENFGEIIKKSMVETVSA